MLHVSWPVKKYLVFQTTLKVYINKKGWSPLTSFFSILFWYTNHKSILFLTLVFFFFLKDIPLLIFPEILFWKIISLTFD
jgi:hypothetical protein